MITDQRFRRLLSRAAMTLLLMLLTTASAWAWTGSGTSDSPYLITSASDLAQLATDVNSGTNYNNVYFKQTAPIELSGEWTPIGTATNPFKGHYDGGNFAITGLQVTGNYQYAGLFGYITSDYEQGNRITTVLKDINIVDCNISVGSVTSSNAGAIAGRTGTVNISGCRVSGSITGYSYACGLIGHMNETYKLTVSNCFADVSVYGTSPNTPPYMRLMAYADIDPSTSGNYCHDRIGRGGDAGITATSLYMVKGAPSGVTVAETNATLTFNATPYFAAGATTTLTVDDAHKAFNDNFGVSGTGSSYTLAGNKRSATVTIGSGDVTVSATLRNFTYTVIFNGNGSTGGSMSNQAFEYSVAQDLSKNAFSRAFTVNYNYNGATGGNGAATATATSTFNGWATSAGGAKVYNDQQSVSNLIDTDGATVNLYAKWTDNSVTLPSPTRTGYTFGGWYSDEGLTAKVGNAGASYTPSASITLYAKWTPVTYTIDYNLNGGSLATANPATYTIETATFTLNNPTKTGFIFGGWYNNEELTGTAVTTIAKGSTGNMTLYAKWLAPYIDANGDTQTCTDYTVLTNSTVISDLKAGWYVVYGNVSYSSCFACGNGDIHLILCDGAKMTVTNNDGNAIHLANGNLTIYAQSTGSNMGQLEATSSNTNCILAYGNVTICGGHITATGKNSNGCSGIYASQNITIHGGQVSATGDYGVEANGTITLGLRNATDYITASRYYAKGTISIADGQTLYDELGNAYNGTLADEQKNALASKTLKPSLYISGTGDDWDHAYMIYNKDQLDLLAQRVNNGNDYSGKHFKLGANITYTYKADDEPGADTENNYTAIGNNNRPFSGHFDGNGFTISGIRICQGGSDNQGLFGYIDGSTAEVKNVVLADARIIGKADTGGIVGCNNGGTVTNCHALSTVTIHAVQDNAWNHGGIVGYVNNSNGTVSGCTSAASITTVTGIYPIKYKNIYYGGIVGYNDGTVKDCLYLGNTLEGYSSVGAIVGKNDISATVQNCYFTSTTIRGKDGSVTPLANAASAVGENYGTITTTGLPRTVTADESVTIKSVTFTGDATQYGTDGITAYSGGGLAYGGKLYYGSECVLSLTLSELPTGEAPAGCHYGYYVNAGTLAAAGDNYTLTMPDANVTLSALTPIDWATVSDGTGNNPYIIYNKGQLDLLAKRVNSGTGDDYAADGYDGKYFKLGADITYTHKAANEEGADTEDNYTAIGNDNAHRFFGHFDGQNHTISGIRIYKGDSEYQGLFGHFGNAEVKNVILADARITGRNETGGIVGLCESHSIVSNCHVLGDVTIHAVKTSFRHGGIVGYVSNSNGTVSGCTSAANITVAANVSCDFCGGIIGYNHGTVKDCLYLGNTVEGVGSVGAIAGYNGNGGTVQNCYFTSTAITGKDGSGNDLDNADSAVGDDLGNVITTGLPRTVTAAEGITIESTTHSGNVTQYGTDGITAYSGGGLAYGGQFYYGSECVLRLTLSGLPTSGAPEGYQWAYTASAGTLTGSANPYTLTMPDANVTISAALVSSSAIDDWATASTGAADNPYIINNKEQLDLLAQRVNSGNTYKNKYFKLGADIVYDHSGLGETESNYTAIGNVDNPFNGHFDGQNLTVSGIRIHKGSSNYQALFGRTGSDATVKNIVLTDALITGKSYTAGIVGYNEGTVTNCHVLSDVTIHVVRNNTQYHGGIVGYNCGATVSGCTSAASITRAANVPNCVDCGGIAGYNTSSGTVKDCLYLGNTVEGNGSVGGIVGYLYSSTVQNCYSTNSALSAVDGSQNSTVTNCGVARTVTAGVGVTIESMTLSGSVTNYGEGGITVYSDGGIGYGDKLYYGNGCVLSLTLNRKDASAPLGYQFTDSYTASAGTLTGSANSYTLTMPDANVIISVLVPIDWATVTDGNSDASAYMIYNKDQLDLLAQRVNNGESYSGKYFKLGADIAYDPDVLTIDNNGDGTVESNYTAIGGYHNDNNQVFRGHFDGDNRTVSGIRLYKGGSKNADQYQGLFGHIGETEVKNVILADARIMGHYYVGGIVGYNDGGTITNCHALSNVTIQIVMTNPSPNGGQGGIVGYNHSNSSVTGCTSATSITSGTASYYYFGGIVGYNNGTVSDCLYLGTKVQGYRYIGAIAGYSNNGSVENTYFTSTTFQGKNNLGISLDNAASAVGYTNNGSVTNCGLAPSDNVDNSKFLTLLAARTQALTAVERTTPLSTDVSLSYSRTFTANVASTICLPFSMTSIEGGKVYRFVGVEYNNTEGWVATMSDATPDGNYVSATQANTPYLFMADSNDKVTFSNDKCTVSTATAGSTTNGDWTFHGTYSRLEYGTDLNGNVYGFASTAEDGVQAGEFVRADDGAAVPPMRCYLTYNNGDPFTGARGVTRGESEEVPETIIVRLIGKNGETEGIGTLTLSTGEFSTDGWYSLDGRRLDGKPTKKGLYIHDGLKVVIK